MRIFLKIVCVNDRIAGHAAVRVAGVHAPVAAGKTSTEVGLRVVLMLVNLGGTMECVSRAARILSHQVPPVA